MLQILLTIFFSSFKFAATFPLVIGQFKFSFVESILWTNVGGAAGIFFFCIPLREGVEVVETTIRGSEPENVERGSTTKNTLY